MAFAACRIIIVSMLQMRTTFWLALLACAAFPLARAEDQPEPRPASGPVYVIPVEGMIEPALVYVIRRGIIEAEREQASALILRMDTPGGRLDAATDIVRLMQRARVPTYTFVERNAISAGAIIALSTKHIYMAPGSVIGDAMPIMMTPTGGPQEMPAALEEKTVSAVAALIRAAAQEAGHDPQLAEAMVRREIEYKIGDEVISPKGQLLTLTNVEAEREVGPPESRRKLLSRGTVKDIPTLLDQIGLSGSRVVELQVTSAERIARWIAAAAPLLLMAGLLGLYIEFKTPGFGLPGLLGLLSLALFFYGHHIAGLAGMEDVVLFLIGVALIAVEIFLLPGFGFPGLIGITLVLYSLLSAMADRVPDGSWLPDFPNLQGPLIKLSSGILMAAFAGVIVGRWLPKSRAGHWLILDRSTSSSQGYTGDLADRSLLGAEGIAITPLRPAGAAEFGDRRVDVVTRGEYEEAGARVRVVEVKGNRIVVEPVGVGKVSS